MSELIYEFKFTKVVTYCSGLNSPFRVLGHFSKFVFLQRIYETSYSYFEGKFR